MSLPPLSAPSRRWPSASVGGARVLARVVEPPATFFDLWLSLGGPIFYGKGQFEAARAVAEALGDPDRNWAHDPGDPALALEVAKAILSQSLEVPT